jgi:ribonuclease P protein component
VGVNENHTKPFAFSKKERLKSKKDIEELFKKGSSFFVHPLLTKYSPARPTENTHKVVVTVPKKHIKSAVKRNLVKRRIREAYRKNKSIISDYPAAHLAFLYLTPEILDYQTIENKLIKSLDRLSKSRTDII